MSLKLKGAFAIFISSGSYGYFAYAAQISETHGTGLISIIYANIIGATEILGIIVKSRSIWK